MRYYYNTLTGERTEVPPSCAVPASAPPAQRPAPASPVRAMAQPTRPWRVSQDQEIYLYQIISLNLAINYKLYYTYMIVV